jgi:hypothetical protein
LDAYTALRAMIAFTSTKIKVYRAMMSKAGNIRYKQSDGSYRTPDLYAHRWRLRTAPENNKKGDFFNFSLDLAMPGKNSASLIRQDDPLFAKAVEFYDQWEGGQIKADYGSSDASDESSSASNQDDDLPF